MPACAESPRAALPSVLRAALHSALDHTLVARGSPCTGGGLANGCFRNLLSARKHRTAVHNRLHLSSSEWKRLSRPNCLTAGSGTGPPRRHRVLNRALPQIVGWCKVNCYVCLGGPSILKRHGKRGNCDASVQRPPALSRAPLLRFDDPAQRAAHSPSRTFRQRVHQSAQMASRHAFSKEAKLCPGTAVAVGRPWSVFRAGHAAAS